MEKINSDLVAAMKARDQVLVGTLRMMVAALKNKRIELIIPELNDEQTIQVLASEIKKRKDSIESYRQGKREDLAEIEEAEIAIIQAYLPAQLSEAEVEEAVREVVKTSGPADKAKFGQLMGQCMAKLKGQADGQAVKAALEKIMAE